MLGKMDSTDSPFFVIGRAFIPVVAASDQGIRGHATADDAADKIRGLSRRGRLQHRARGWLDRSEFWTGSY